MRFLGLSFEEPFGAASWSGSMRNFFSEMKRQDMLADALRVDAPSHAKYLWLAATFCRPRERWRERFYARPELIDARTRALKDVLARAPRHDALLQVGAYFNAARATDKPCYSYHDGNAAVRYAEFAGGLLSQAERQRHLDKEREIYASMTGILTMSAWLKQSFVRDFGIDPGKVHVVGGAFNFSEVPQETERDFTKPRFLFVGREFERKGGQFLLEAFDIVRRKRPDSELHIVGPEKREGSPGVHFEGYLNKADADQRAHLESLFAQATTIVLPSVYEPFGISLIEGMLHGIPAIAVDRCAMPEIVLSGKSGLIAKAKDAASLAEAMLEIADHPERSREWGTFARARVLSDFTWKAVVERVGAVASRHSPATGQKAPA